VFCQVPGLGSVGRGEEDREGAEDGGGWWGFEDGGEGVVVRRQGGCGCGFGIGSHGAPVRDDMCVDEWGVFRRGETSGVWAVLALVL
jgi:hypothetical protein